MSPAPIYLDYQASTPLDPRVAAVMERHTECYGNPHTTSHSAGIDAGKAVNIARRLVARAIGGDARRLVFTSGATEANNLAIFGAARANCGRPKVVTIATEHSSVLKPALALRDEGFEVNIVPVQWDGVVNLEKLESIVDDRTNIVSVMHINNETGVIQPIAQIAEICHRAGAVLHSDCAQSLGRVPVDVNVLGADLLTLSAHKCYGPKGIGALYIGGRPRIALKPLALGGGQEGGLRPGTVPVSLCIGFGEACRLSAEEVQVDADRMDRLRARLLETILHVFPTARLNGSSPHRAPGVLNVCFPGATSDELIYALEGMQVSSGSACASSVVEPSRVLLAHGLTEEEANASLRMSVGRFTTEEDMSLAEEVIRMGLRKLGS